MDIGLFEQKKHVGILLPSVQTVTEPLFNRILGKKYDFHAQRVRLLGGRVEDLMAMEEHVPEACEALADANVEILVYCCAGSGAILGAESESNLCEKIKNKTGIPMVSSMKCCAEAIKSTGAEKVTLVGPNSPEISHTEVDYLEKAGIKVIGHYGFGIVDGRLFSKISPDDIKEKAIANWNPDSDAMFIACMNWWAANAICGIQKETGRPVITSHIAVLWKIYCSLEEEIPYNDFVMRFVV